MTGGDPEGRLSLPSTAPSPKTPGLAPLPPRTVCTSACQ